MVVWRKSKMKENTFTTYTKHYDELPVEPIEFIKSQVESKINKGYSDIFQ